MSELLNCPYCGGEAKRQIKRPYRGKRTISQYRIIDGNTECAMFPSTRWCDTQEEADTIWNRRAQPANEPLTLEQLEETTDPVYISGYYPPEYHINDNWYLVDHDEKMVYRDGDCIPFCKVIGCAYAHKPGGEQNGN